jgi:hypothetical protein
MTRGAEIGGECWENVASVEVLPMTMLPIANERKTAMKKMMMAVGFAARIHIGIAYASKRDQNRKWRFMLV